MNGETSGASARSHRFVTAVAVYTVLFALCAVFAFGEALITKGSLLIVDGMEQYLPFLTQLRRDMLTFADSIAKGSPALPMYNFNSFAAPDTVTSTAPDFVPFLPFYALSCLFPEDSMALFLAAAVIVLSYLSGLSFMHLCVHFGKDILLSAAVSPMYVFCGCFMFHGWCNPHFIYMFIAFPLMITGIDNILHDKSGVPFALSIAFPALGGIHLLAYTVPFVVIFAAIRVYHIYKDAFLRNLIKYFIRGTLFTLLGLLMSSVMLLPFLYNLFTSVRSIGSTGIDLQKLLVPDIAELSGVFAGSISENCTSGVCAALIPTFLYAVIFPREKKELRAHCTAAALMILFPVVSYAVNGFQYDICRWGFVPAAVMCYAFAEYAPVIAKPEKEQIRPLVLITAVWLMSVTLLPEKYRTVPLIIIAFASFVPSVRRFAAEAAEKLRGTFTGEKKTVFISAAVFTVLACAAVILISGSFRPDLSVTLTAAVIAAAGVTAGKVKSSAPTAVMLVCACAVTQALFMQGQVTPSVELYDGSLPVFYDHVKGMEIPDGRTGRLIGTDDISDAPVLSPEEPPLTKEEQNFFYNSALLYDIPASDVFNSTVSGDLLRFLYRTEQDGYPMKSIGEISGFSYKEVLYSLFGIDNIYTRTDCPYIYGTQLSDEIGVGRRTYKIYKNDFSLPLGVTYDKLMSGERFAPLGPVQLPYAMMNEVWLDGYEGDINDSDTVYSRVCGYDIESAERGTTTFGISCFDNKVTLKDSTKGCFLYMQLDGVREISYGGSIGETFVVSADGGEEHRYLILNSEYDFPWARHADSYTLSLGYCPEDVRTLDFITPFEYHSLTIFAVPASCFTEAYEARTRETLHNIQKGINTLTGDITVSSDCVLTVNMLYSRGWTAYVDGEQAEIYKANGLFIGAPLAAGSHTVKLVYRTPFLYEGAALSAVGIVTAIIINVCSSTVKKLQSAA